MTVTTGVLLVAVSVGALRHGGRADRDGALLATLLAVDLWTRWRSRPWKRRPGHPKGKSGDTDRAPAGTQLQRRTTNQGFHEVMGITSNDYPCVSAA